MKQDQYSATPSSDDDDEDSADLNSGTKTDKAPDLPSRNPNVFYVHDGGVFDENDENLLIPDSDTAALATDDFEEEYEDSQPKTQETNYYGDDVEDPPETNHQNDYDAEISQDSDSAGPGTSVKPNRPLQTPSKPKRLTHTPSKPSKAQSDREPPTKPLKKPRPDPAPNSFQYLMGFTKGSDHEDYVKRRKEGRRVNMLRTHHIMLPLLIHFPHPFVLFQICSNINWKVAWSYNDSNIRRIELDKLQKLWEDKYGYNRNLIEGVMADCCSKSSSVAGRRLLLELRQQNPDIEIKRGRKRRAQEDCKYPLHCTPPSH